MLTHFPISFHGISVILFFLLNLKPDHSPLEMHTEWYLHIHIYRFDDMNASYEIQFRKLIHELHFK